MIRVIAGYGVLHNLHTFRILCRHFPVAAVPWGFFVGRHHSPLVTLLAGLFTKMYGITD